MNELRPQDWIEAKGKDVRCPDCGDRLWVKAAGSTVFVRSTQGRRANDLHLRREGDTLEPSRVEAHAMRHHRCKAIVEFIVVCSLPGFAALPDLVSTA